MPEMMTPPQETEEMIEELKPSFKTRRAEPGEFHQIENGKTIEWFAWYPESVNGIENISDHGATEDEARDNLENKIRRLLAKE